VSDLALVLELAFASRRRSLMVSLGRLDHLLDVQK
jgi:hypothetical protein